jgi:uncharacterized protein (TIGR02722 family)
MLRQRLLPTFFIVFVIGLLMACAMGPTVHRVDVKQDIELSGRWNDTDSRIVAEEMIKDCLERPWADNFRAEHGQKMPAVIVGSVKNRSHEHINVQTFTKDLERALINSGRVRFVASKGEREEIRKERLDMAQHASDDTMKGPGQEYGADFMLIGTINTIRDEVKGTALMYYQINLELVSLENNVKSWIGEKRIKKLIKRPSISW